LKNNTKSKYLICLQSLPFYIRFHFNEVIIITFGDTETPNPPQCNLSNGFHCYRLETMQTNAAETQAEYGGGEGGNG